MGTIDSSNTIFEVWKEGIIVGDIIGQRLRGRGSSNIGIIELFIKE